MKNLLFASFFLIFACACGVHGQELPTIDPELKQNIQEGIEKELENIPGIPPVNISAFNIDEGEKLLEEKCKKNGGNTSFDDFMMAREEFNFCIQPLVNVTELQVEIENAKPTGDLDLVFSKYCKKSPILKECVTNFTTGLEPCLDPKEKQTKRVFQNVSESLLDFICFKEGDRIALFIAEKGPECLSDKKEAIKHCMNITLSKFIPKEGANAENIPLFKLEKEECTALKNLHLCVVSELEKCNETTPSNIVDSLMKFMMKQTPCNDFGLYPSESGVASCRSSSLFSLIALIPFFVSYLWR